MADEPRQEEAAVSEEEVVVQPGGLAEDGEEISPEVAKILDVVPADSQQAIDAVDKALEVLVVRRLQSQRDELTQLFFNQLDVLRKRGVPERALQRFYHMQQEVLERAKHMAQHGHVSPGNLPFFPVISREAFSLAEVDEYGLARLLELLPGGNSSYCHSFTGRFADNVKRKPPYYYIFDVSSGYEYHDYSACHASSRIKDESRQPLIVEELIFLSLFNRDVMADEGFIAASSFQPFMPWLHQDNSLTLCHARADMHGVSVPSCRYRQQIPTFGQKVKSKLSKIF